MTVRTLRAPRWALLLAIVGSLVACSTGPHRPAGQAPIVTPGTPAPRPDLTGSIQRPKARWLPVSWTALPGWDSDATAQWWPALHHSCTRPVPAWQTLCTEVRKLGPGWGESVGDAFVRQWVQSHLQPWRIVAPDGQVPAGLLTGYFEPLLDGRRTPDARFRYPLHRPPADLSQRKPHYSRAELDTLPAARAALQGRELVYLADPLDVLLIQVQGSGRVRLLDEADASGQPKVVRLAFNGHNDQPYQSVGRWLVDQGAMSLDQASWPAIRQWAQANPHRVTEMMQANPRVVYFREEVLKDPQGGPVGAQGVPLTAGRSIAVDRDAIPLGAPVWLDSTWPQAWSQPPATPQPLRRLVMAQDTGGAIQGSVRADFYWGTGDEALLHAGRTRQALALWALWPRGVQP